jgi:pilus assembly protein Flp/PilA
VVTWQRYAEVLKLLAATGNVTLVIGKPGDLWRRKGKRTMLMRIGRGQGMLEYALIIALVALVVIASLVLLGPQIARIFDIATNNL